MLSSCFLFRSPKAKEVTIQNPPPTDRNYLACRVNGKPTLFKRFGPPFRNYSSMFSVQQDLDNNTLVIEVNLYGGISIAKDRYDEISVSETYVINNDLVVIDSALFEKRDVTQASFKRTIPRQSEYLTYQTYRYNLSGSIRVTDFEYRKDPKTGAFKGHVSGVFALSSTPSRQGDIDESSVINIADGVFNVSEIEQK